MSETPTIRLSVPKTAKRGDIVEIKAMIRHDMESGYRINLDGTKIPRQILRHFNVQHKSETLFAAEFHPGVSANPLIKFFLRVPEPLDLVFTWTEDTGQTFSKRASIMAL